MVAPIEIVFGSICPFHQTFSDPGRGRDEASQREGQRAMERNVEAERCHPDRVVANTLERHAERCTPDHAESDVGEHGEHEADVVQPHRPVEQRRRIDAGDAAEAGEGRHLAEDVVADHGVGERQHQEVDAVGAARQRTENQGDDGGDHERGDDRRPTDRARA